MANGAFGIQRIFRALAALTLLFAVAGCASLPEDPVERAEVVALNDPFEPANRMMFAINEAVDTFILRPVAVLYRDFMPTFAKELLYNFTQNLTLPLTIINDLLQGEFDRAGVAAQRLFVNTVAGFGGFVDAATGLGLPHHEEDFGQTLATYDVVPGPYIVLPLLGPSSGRHTVGRVVDFAINPFSYLFASAPLEYTLVPRAVSIVDQRYRLLGPLDETKRTSFDYYATVRSLYRQRRNAAIRNLDERPPFASPTERNAAHSGATLDESFIASGVWRQ